MANDVEKQICDFNFCNNSVELPNEAYTATIVDTEYIICKDCWDELWAFKNKWLPEKPKGKPKKLPETIPQKEINDFFKLVEIPLPPSLTEQEIEDMKKKLEEWKQQNEQITQPSTPWGYDPSWIPSGGPLQADLLNDPEIQKAAEDYISDINLKLETPPSGQFELIPSNQYYYSSEVGYVKDTTDEKDWMLFGKPVPKEEPNTGVMLPEEPDNYAKYKGDWVLYLDLSLGQLCTMNNKNYFLVEREGVKGKWYLSPNSIYKNKIVTTISNNLVHDFLEYIDYFKDPYIQKMVDVKPDV